MTATTPDQPQAPLVCRSCGADAIVLAYCVPVYVFAKSGRAARVVVADEEVVFRRRIWCRRCGDILNTQEEPDIGTWPAWEVGW